MGQDFFLKTVPRRSDSRMFLGAKFLYEWYTVCPRSSDLFYILTYYLKWVPTSWTHSTNIIIG